MKIPAKLVGLAALSFAGAASSEPSPVRFPVEQPVALAARVALLEQKLHALEQRSKALEKVAITRDAGGAYQLVANGARVRIAPDGTVSVDPPPPRPVEDPCDPPFTVDLKGIRSIKPECLKVPACDPPFTVDKKGVRAIKPECAKATPCDPPYAIDPQGRRVPKAECL